MEEVRIKRHFSGSTPPEIFVGRYDYPNVFSGIITPPEKGETEILASPEAWFEKRLSIEQVLEFRKKLVYGRKKSNIRSQDSIQNLNKVVQQVALSSKPVAAEYFLKSNFQKPKKFIQSKHYPLIPQPIPLERVRLEENPKVDKKVDYLTSDYDVKSVTALEELYKSKTKISYLSKILSAGLLGVKANRKMVPTRWAITAVDDTLSKNSLKKIKTYPEINDILLFNAEYNGNHYEILLLPEQFSFEVIEADAKVKSLQNPNEISSWQDFEGFFGRREYAPSVTGAYYANRLAVCEYLEKIKRQAKDFVMREVRQEYYAPLGVGILREVTRHAFTTKPQVCKTVDEAFELINQRTQIPAEFFKTNSWILKDFGKQKKLKDWF